MDGMSVYAAASKADQKRIRKEMLQMANEALGDSLPDGLRRAAARRLVDEALAKETRVADEA